MKILQIIDSLCQGGAERMAVNMANALSDKGIVNVVCVTRKIGPMKSFLDKKVIFCFLNKKAAFDVFAFVKLLRLIARHKPDLVHAHSSSYLWAILAKMFYRNLVIIWHDHNGLSEKLKPKDRFVLRKLSRKINGIIVVNKILKEWNIKNTLVPEAHIRLINNFPDYKEYKQKNKSPYDINLLCLANFKPEKDHLMLIRAFKMVTEKFADNKISLWLAGNSYNKSYDMQIRNLVNELQLQEKVMFLGPVHNTQELLSKAHIGVLTSYSEGLPVSLLEYGMAELPVVVTDVGQCKEVVQNGQCGWLVKHHDAEAFAEAIGHIILNPSEARTKSKLLKERINLKYGATQFVSEYIDFLNAGPFSSSFKKWSSETKSSPAFFGMAKKKTSFFN